MAIQRQWKRRLVALELLSLIILIGSLALLGQASGASGSLSPAWLLVPALASLTMFLSFLGLMYMRWVASAAHGERKGLHTALFVIMAVMLMAIWTAAMVQTWQSLEPHPSATIQSGGGPDQ